MGQLEETQEKEVGESREKEGERGAKSFLVVRPERETRDEEGREARREKGIEEEVPPVPISGEEEERHQTERGDRYGGSSRDHESRQELRHPRDRRSDALEGPIPPRDCGQEDDRGEQRGDDRRVRAHPSVAIL
jgi:hypothetical protein